MHLIFLLSPQNDIENNVVPSPRDFNQLSNKFKVLKQDAQEIADALTPLSKYLGYQYIISESLKQYLNKKVINCSIFMATVQTPMEECCF